MVPDLHEVRRAGHPVRADDGCARPTHPLLPAGRRAARRDLLVLPRAEVRHPARVRAVDRARGEAHAHVAEPLLLDHRVRAEALPDGHHQLREHPGRRQDHLERLLPRRPELRPDLLGAARRAVPRSRRPKFLHENATQSSSSTTEPSSTRARGRSARPSTRIPRIACTLPSSACPGWGTPHPRATR